MVEPKSAETDAWRLVGLDTFAGEWYPVSEHASEAEAEMAARARLIKLEQEQPPTSSGGQRGGIQDRVFVVSPDGKRRRILG